MQPVIKQTKAPPTNALKTIFEIIRRLSGINDVNTDVIIPIEPGLEKPVIAYVAITLARTYNKKRNEVYM